MNTNLVYTRKMVLLLCVLCLTLTSKSQIITTIAGTGVSGFTGDGGLATLAQLTYIQEVSFDKHKNLYLSTASNRMRKIDTNGFITTYAGNGIPGYGGDGGPAIAAQMKQSTGIAADTHGNIYFADRLNYYIRKIDPLGIITTIAGTGAAGYSGDGGPAILAQIYTGYIYIYIYILTTSETFTSVSRIEFEKLTHRA